MPGKFILKENVQRDKLEIAQLGWLSTPASTGATHLTVIEGTFFPGKGHNFHYHAGQEELIYVVAGSLEHWIEKEKRTLGPGDSVFMPAGVVHATFNVGSSEAKILAVLGPCVGDIGVENIDVSHDAPWSELRTNTVLEPHPSGIN
jgi:quercetin dioxygenase-like cupin family protein